MSKKQKILIGFKTTIEEKAEITHKAFESNMSISNYIKYRLLEDVDKEQTKLTEYEKLQIACSLKTFYLLQEIINPSKNLKNIDRIKKIVKEADKCLVKEGFKTKEDFNKLYKNNN